jgi:hypothetical protein
MDAVALPDNDDGPDMALLMPACDDAGPEELLQQQPKKKAKTKPKRPAKAKAKQDGRKARRPLDADACDAGAQLSPAGKDYKVTLAGIAGQHLAWTYCMFVAASRGW